MPREKTIERIVEYASHLEGFNPSVIRDGLELTHLHRLIEQLIENHLTDWGLNIRLVEILECLFHQETGIMTPAELSLEVNLSRSAMTWALDSLEKLGYALRQPHPTDRRMFEISLTAVGREFIQARLPDRYSKFQRIMGVLSKAERVTILQAYRKIISLLQEE